MWARSVFKGRGSIALLFQHLGLALVGVLVVVTGELPCTAAQNRELAVSVARRDLRPLGLVTVELSGAVNLQGVTEDNGRVAFPGLPLAGAITVTPSRSGFRFEPPQLTIPDSANPSTVAFTAFPTATDLGLSIETDNASPLVGGLVTGVITLRNLGAEAATDIAVGFGSLPGLVLEARQTTQGRLETRIYDTVWTLPQLNPGASAEVHYQARATLADANVLAFVLIEEMDQADIDPLNNLVYLLPGPPPDLAISVTVDKPQVNVGEYAIFVVTVTNRAAQPAFAVIVRETDALDADFALETVRSYGPGGDDRVNSASRRTIPRIEPGASYSMSRTMRVRKPVTIPYFAKVEGVNGLFETQLPVWLATTEVTGVQVTSDIAPVVVADRANVKSGDLVNFAVIARNVSSSRVASHVVLDAAQSAGFQVLGQDLSGYGYFFDTARPRDLSSSWEPFAEWTEIRPREEGVWWMSTYTVGAGQFTVGARMARLDQLDAQATNDLALASINSAPASARVSVRQSIRPQNARVGDLVMFTTEIRNEGPDRVTGLSLLESSSTNLELNVSPAVNGVSGDLVTSIWDSLVRLPALEPGQNFVWQRTYGARSAGNAWRRVRVERFDQTALAPLPESNGELGVQPAQADLELRFLEAPSVGQESIPALVGVRVRNLGPAVATGVRVAVNVPADALYLGGFGYGPRATYVFFEPNVFQTALLPGESATVGFYVTPRRDGTVTGFVQLQQSDQVDPNPANDTLSWTMNIGPAPRSRRSCACAKCGRISSIKRQSLKWKSTRPR
jgi:uncharacterized repeat protein (TIGR01451 family)